MVCGTCAPPKSVVLLGSIPDPQMAMDLATPSKFAMSDVSLLQQVGLYFGLWEQPGVQGTGYPQHPTARDTLQLSLAAAPGGQGT